MDPAPSRRGRPPSADAERAILEAAVGLVREQGPLAVTIEAVAGRAGVARTTVYRRHRNRSEVLAAAVQHLTDQPAPPPELPVADKLRWLLDRVVTVIGSGLGTGGVAAVLAGDDPDFTAAFRAALDAQLAPLAAAAAADARAGRLRVDVDGEGLVDLVLGAVLAELLRHGTVRPGWADRTLGLLVVATG